MYFGNRDGCILTIFPENFLINFFDKIFIKPARQINLIFFLDSKFNNFFSAIFLFLKSITFFCILYAFEYFNPLALLVLEIINLILKDTTYQMMSDQASNADIKWLLDNNEELD